MRKIILVFCMFFALIADEINIAKIRENIFNLSDEELIKSAKLLNLVPIPSNKYELEELIKNISPDYEKYPTTDKRIQLGKKLFFDPRLSRSGIISCNTCHNLALGGVDGIGASTGHKWQANSSHLNAPSVYNAVFNARQFWDGRINHLKEQAKGPLQANVEMASSSDDLVAKIKSIPEYVDEFKKAYSNDIDIDFDLIAASIGIFERTLITPSSFDEFLEGDINALTSTQKQGLKLFINKGCVMCHNGINIGGAFRGFGFNRYQYVNYGDFRGNENNRVKVPSLRNVAKTAPYFHNGSVWTLVEAVESMARIQLAIELSEEEIKDIIAFLKSLSGKMPQIVYPELPASSDETIRPRLDY
nr:cytochrome-c peroxidase [Campylobacter canadensis]